MIAESSGLDALQPSKLGMLMSQHYLGIETMKMMPQLAQTPSSTAYLLQFLAGCKEIQQHPLRRSEKKVLNQLNDGKIRYRAKGVSIKNVVNTTEMKVNILIQAGIGRLLHEYDPLYSEMQECMEGSERVLRGKQRLREC